MKYIYNMLTTNSYLILGESGKEGEWGPGELIGRALGCMRATKGAASFLARMLDLSGTVVL